MQTRTNAVGANSGKRGARASGSSVRATRSKPAVLTEEDARRRLAGSSKLYYRIGEVSELTGVKAHVLRYWETEFRWMAPPKSRSKQRLYRKRDIEFVWLLKKLLWEQRFTIAGARQRIQELGLDEALARQGDADLQDEALAISARIAAASAPAIAAGDGDSSGLQNGEGVSRRDVAAERGESSIGSADWLGIRVALESMQDELLALRGVLQQGL